LKGVFLQDQVEYRLEVDGDSYHQGDVLSGKLKLKNYQSVSKSLEQLQLKLVVADIKKAKQKEQGAFELKQTVTLPAAIKLESGSEFCCDWQFMLDSNIAITDKAQNLYLLVGCGQNLEDLFQLPLMIEPHKDIFEFLSILESSFQFVVKGKKSVKDLVVVKINPSSAAKYSVLDQVTLSFQVIPETALMVKYSFTIKHFEASAVSLGVKKSKAMLEQCLSFNEYKRDGFVEHAVVENYIRQALAEVLK